jgi:hypothetical protein
MKNSFDAVRVWVGQRRKSIVAVVVGAIAAQFIAWGVDLSTAQEDMLTLFLTGLSVYLFPNDPS